MISWTPDSLHRLLASAAGLSPVRLQAVLERAGARPDWVERGLEGLQRVEDGDEAEQVASEVIFRGRRFSSDDRACWIRDYLSVFVDRMVDDWSGRDPKVHEVGCGAGAVICSLALEMEGSFTGSDISAPAVELAAENAARLGAAVVFHQGDLLDGVRQDVDVIFANLPYEPPERRLPEEHWEPAVSLYDRTREDLGLIRRLLRQLPTGLEHLYMELPGEERRQRHFAGHHITLDSGEVVGVRMTRSQARETLENLDEVAAATRHREEDDP